MKQKIIIEIDLRRAKDVLDADHAGLVLVKQRIIEFLAVRTLNPKAKGSILLLHGPPGVGKTSLGKSVAAALGRKYERVSLGGISDESILRGHRRTYLGAYTGIIMQSIRRAGTRNPVILLDEIDKVSPKNYHGDPSGALLEVLDPAQNHKFMDHYLNIPFDISDVFFIATANRIDTIHPALFDRMDPIALHGYTQKEKLDILTRYILAKVQKEHGIPPNTLELTTTASQKLISEYTAEAGVRTLEKRAAAGHVAVDYLRQHPSEMSGDSQNKQTRIEKMEKVIIKEEDLLKILGPPKFRENTVTPHVQPGTAFGLAWTEMGGKVLTIETSYSRGSGKVVLTGQLGDVMKESVSTAISWIKSNYKRLNLRNSPIIQELSDTAENTNSRLSGARDDLLDKIDLHIHFPSAAIPKDGPSAGVTIACALVSLLTGVKVKSEIAMTGEITLTGKVLPVGGIKEKIMAASVAGLKTVVIPLECLVDFEKMENKEDLNLSVTTAKSIMDILELALERDPSTLWTHSSNDRLSKSFLALSKL